MKINTKEHITNLAGKDMENADKTPATVGSIIADILAASETGGKMKMYVLAKKFFDEKEVELDDADLALVKQSVEASKGYSNIVVGQILLKLGA